MKINHLTGNIYSDEWYTDQKTVDLCISLLKPEPASRIICPFDSEESLFVKTLKSQGHTVLYGMTDFLLDTHYEFDYVVTNPPFSLKDPVIQKVYEYGKKAVLILPLDSLGGVKRHDLYDKHGYPDIYLPSRRISYYDQNWIKRQSPNFHSVILTFNRGQIPSSLAWEKEFTP